MKLRLPAERPVSDAQLARLTPEQRSAFQSYRQWGYRPRQSLRLARLLYPANLGPTTPPGASSPR